MSLESNINLIGVSRMVRGVEGPDASSSSEEQCWRSGDLTTIGGGEGERTDSGKPVPAIDGQMESVSSPQRCLKKNGGKNELLEMDPGVLVNPDFSEAVPYKSDVRTGQGTPSLRRRS